MGSWASFIGGCISNGAQHMYGIHSSWQSAKQEASNIREQARLSAAETMRQANATAEAQRAQGRQRTRESLMAMMDADNEVFRAGEELHQGDVAETRAILEQRSGEAEAAKRSRQLASEIGGQYANFAANGFDVAANPTDTFGSILRTSATEGQADVDAILGNAQLNQWTFEETARAQRRSAVNSIRGANNAVFKAKAAADSSKDAYAAAALTLANGRAAAADTLSYGRRAAHAALKSGKRARTAHIIGAILPNPNG